MSISHISSWTKASLAVALVMLLLGSSVAAAWASGGSFQAAYQPPPPPVEASATPGAAGGGGTGFLAVLEGYVWEEGDTFRPLANVVVRYTSDGVIVDETTDKNGYFRFTNIGPDGGTLELNDAKWQSGTGGVMIKPLPGQTVRVNLAALPKGKAVASQVALSAVASAASAAAGQTVTFTLKVTNGTQNVISGLMLGDQLPDGVTVSGVATSRGDVLARGPVMVAVDLNALAAGDSATVTIVTLVNRSISSPQGLNRATLLYREGPAISARANIGLAGEPTALPVTGVAAPIAAALILIVVLLAARWARTRAAA